MIFLETARLLFRTHEVRDQDAFVAMHTDPEVRRFVGGSAWPVEKALHRFQTQYLGQPTNTYGLWATILKEENRYIGCCGLSKAENRADASLGYYLARPYWGHGLASEASAAFIETAFNRLRLPRILADAEKEHAASERILQKFGFRYARQEEIPGNGRIICHYELQCENWAKN